MRELRDGFGQLWWGLGAVVTSVAIATWAAWPIYGTPRLAVVAAAGLILGAGAILASVVFRWSWWTSALVAVGGYLLLVVPVAVPSALGDPGRILRGVLDGLAGIVLGWKQLLTVSLPAGDYQAVLVPFFVTITLGSLVAVALIAAGGKLAPFAALPMLAMTAFGAVFGSSTVGNAFTLGPIRIPAPAHVLLGTLALVVAVTWLLGRARLTRARALRIAQSRTNTVRQGSESSGVVARRYLLATGLVVVALVAGTAAAPVASVFGARDVLRDDVDPLLIVQQQASPLSAYRGWFAGDNFDRELFSVDAPDSVDRLRIASLDTFDGQTFRVGGGDENRFSRVPRTAGSDAAVQITIGEGYTGVWVPILAAEGAAPRFTGPRAEELADSYYGSNALDAAVVVPNGDATGLREGDGYRLDVAPAADLDQFERAGGGDSLLRAKQHPVLEAWVEEQEVPRTGAGVLDLVERLRDRGYLSHASRDDADAEGWIAALAARAEYEFAPVRSGHSTMRIEELFTSLVEQQRRAGDDAPPEMLVAAVGDDEQFATAAALIARHLGFESRVVVGVRLGDTGDNFAVPPCAEVCTGENLTAWAEARSSGGDWVVLDATPQFEVTPTLIREGEEPPRNPTLAEEPAAEVLEPPSAQSDDASGSSDDDIVDPPWTEAVLPVVITVLVSAAGVALVFLPFLVFPFAKTLRRRGRRAAAEPEVAMVGAWDELLDHYRDHGIEVPRGLTRIETADAVERPAAFALAELVDRAVFSEHPPASEARDETWRLVDAERRDIVRESGFRTRIRAILTPASLLHHVRPGGMSSTTTTRLRRKATR